METAICQLVFQNKIPWPNTCLDGGSSGSSRPQLTAALCKKQLPNKYKQINLLSEGQWRQRDWKLQKYRSGPESKLGLF